MQREADRSTMLQIQDMQYIKCSSTVSIFHIRFRAQVSWPNCRAAALHSRPERRWAVGHVEEMVSGRVNMAPPRGRTKCSEEELGARSDLSPRQASSTEGPQVLDHAAAPDDLLKSFEHELFVFCKSLPTGLWPLVSFEAVRFCVLIR